MLSFAWLLADFISVYLDSTSGAKVRTKEYTVQSKNTRQQVRQPKMGPWGLIFHNLTQKFS
jgi:hypothetical protein